jgi:carboxyl-terminal processing protease
MSAPQKKSVLRTAAALTVVILLALGSVVGVAWVQKARAVTDDTYSYLETFNQVLSIVQRDYVKEVDAKKLIYGAIRGMLKTLDPHTQFYSKEEFDQMREDLSGEFGGLGIHISVKESKLIVIAPIEGTPAWDAGIKPDDWIVKIDGEATEDMTINDAVDKMRGPVGESVTISVVRKDWDEPKDFTLVRAIIKIKSVQDKKLEKGDIAYVKLGSFTENSEKELKDAIKALQDQAGAPFKGFILDLRDNPGGPLDQAVLVSDLFLASGPIVSVRGRTETQPTRYAHKGGPVEDVPLIAIVNQHAASASEIVAGALQDHGRAVILGVKSFGKGSVQQLLPLKEGAGLKITTAYYYTPNERVIQEEGIHPDVVVDELSPEQKAKLKAEEGDKDKKEGKEFREKDLEGHITHEDATKNANAKEADGSTAAGKSGDEKLLPPTVGTDTEDYQLQRAIDLLRSPETFQAVLKRKGG